MSEIVLSPAVISEGLSLGKGGSNGVCMRIPRLASVDGSVHFKVTISALTLTGTNPINPAAVNLASAELVIVPWCCESGSPSNNGVWGVRANVIAASGFMSNPKVPPPLHNYPDRNSGLTEIYLRFEIPIRILMTRSRYVLRCWSD